MSRTPRALPAAAALAATVATAPAGPAGAAPAGPRAATRLRRTVPLLARLAGPPALRGVRPARVERHRP